MKFYNAYINQYLKLFNKATAMFRIKTLLGGHLSLRDYEAQVGEAIAMVKALNRMTLLGMPHSVRIG
ncbi:hypothetical protein [Symbiopectobacterium purcellii]|uniref:hypothetical protein n=1 Tax=Symbiopectobacterium purcellii TaxID=2871826 RepID=UPI003F831995